MNDFLIGREASADIRPNSELVSRRHAMLRGSGQVWELEDLGTSNGTYVNGRRIKNVALSEGDQVSFADSNFIFDGQDLVPAGPDEVPQSGQKIGARNSSLAKPVVALIASIALVGGVIGGGFAIFGPDQSLSSQNLYDPPQDMRSFVDDVTSSTVWVECEGAAGSGFSIDWQTLDAGSSLIVTNHHVVEECVRTGAKPTVANEEFQTSGSIIQYSDSDTGQDLALIKIRKLVRPFSRAPEIGQGQWVMAIGSPEGLGWTTTTGYISKLLDRSSGQALVGGTWDLSEWILHDAPINHGNSGGPLVNSRGQLVGVNTFGWEPLRGLSFSNGWPNACSTIVSCEGSRTWAIQQ